MARLRLTPELEERILASIRAGGYPHVAAESCGVPAATFADWMARGQAKRGRRPYAPFAAAVKLAHAQARLRAEAEAFRDDPRAWLERGPGRETPENPGWSTAVQAAAGDAGQGLLSQAALLQLFASLLEALSAFPEARAAAACRLQELGVRDDDPAGQASRPPHDPLAQASSPHPVIDAGVPG